MLSLLKKLFAKKTEVSEAPWPFPTGPVITKQEPWPEPTQTVSVLSNKVLLASQVSNKKTFEVISAENQLSELLEDLFKDYNVKYKYLSPNRYVRFSIFYNI